MDNDELQPKNYEQVRRQAVDAEITRWSADATLPKHRHSEYRRALDAITRAATSYAVERQAALDWSDVEAFSVILDDAISVISDLRYAVGADEGEDAIHLRLWSHRNQPFHDIKANRLSTLNRREIELVAGRYLDLPYRSFQIDRLFVDLLVATELYAYGYETLGAPSVGIFSASPLNRHPVLEWVAGNLIGLVFWVVVWWLLWSLSRVHLFPKAWLDGTAVVLGLLFLLGLAWSTLSLPGTWWQIRKTKREIMVLLDQMAGVYADLKSDGPISADHIRQRAQAASKAGVVWPAPLFVLLEDVAGRTGRF